MTSWWEEYRKELFFLFNGVTASVIPEALVSEWWPLCLIPSLQAPPLSFPLLMAPNRLPLSLYRGLSKRLRSLEPAFGKSMQAVAWGLTRVNQKYWIGFCVYILGVYPPRPQDWGYPAPRGPFKNTYICSKKRLLFGPFGRSPPQKKPIFLLRPPDKASF